MLEGKLYKIKLSSRAEQDSRDNTIWNEVNGLELRKYERLDVEYVHGDDLMKSTGLLIKCDNLSIKMGSDFSIDNKGAIKEPYNNITDISLWSIIQLSRLENNDTYWFDKKGNMTKVN